MFQRSLVWVQNNETLVLGGYDQLVLRISRLGSSAMTLSTLGVLAALKRFTVVYIASTKHLKDQDRDDQWRRDQSRVGH